MFFLKKMDTSDLKVCMSHLFSEQERIFNEWINKKIEMLLKRYIKNIASQKMKY